MLLKKVMISSIASLGLALGVGWGGAVAQTNHNMDMPSSETSETTQFRRIEQPLGFKIGVTATGLALIGLELWWFLLSKPKSRQAQSNQGVQSATITVDGGYEPSRVVVQAGQRVQLNFLRRDPSSCLEEVRFPDFHIAKALPLNQVTAVEFTPDKPGTYTFTCGMNMFRGTVEVPAAGVKPAETSATASQPTTHIPIKRSTSTESVDG